MNTNQTEISEVKVTGSMVDSMRSTRPWTMLLSVLGFIGAGLFLIIGIVMLFVRALPRQDAQLANAFMGVMYIVFAVVYCFPSLYLFKYSNSVKLFYQRKNESYLESALSYQKSFWKFVGILSIITIVISIVGIIAAILIPLLVSQKSL
jgi:hypothetical protein